MSVPKAHKNELGVKSCILEQIWQSFSKHCLLSAEIHLYSTERDIP